MTEKDDRIAMWMGRRIEDMDCDELIAVIHALGRQVRDGQAWHGRTLDAWSLSMSRRDERPPLQGLTAPYLAPTS